MLDPLRVEAAATRFRAFFEELKGTFFEREDVLRQVALALLSKEHALMTGPPGTAKSQLAHSVIGRIVCEDTGTPSVYARQVTESTVQTDLIGPVDFKHLMETGRTTHFTDEGMLGAAHAFLDEVFDGRDMLLRSALNVLQERELKQGTKVTRGDIEVALMTSNRYIADVIEQSRETLLAFVDRIAFVSFVPRGFADPANMERVLTRHVARKKEEGATKGALDALLTIQDVDVLQELVDEVVVSEPICDGIARLLYWLNAELNDAVRADPQFVPTRYLSTRTAVRCGKILRAIAVYDRIFERPEREAQVLPEDLGWLRLHLLLTGPSPDEVESLLKGETDPLERRQLEILRTEREIFDRCLANLPKLKVPPLKKEQAAAEGKGEDGKKGKGGKKDKKGKKGAKGAKGAKKRAEPDPLAALRERIASQDVGEIVAACGDIAARVSRGGAEASAAQQLMGQATAALERACARATLDASRTDEGSLLDGVEQLVAVAMSVQDDRVSMHAMAKALRGRATAVIDEVARYAAGARSEDLSAEAPSAKQVHELSERRIAVFERLGAARRRLEGAEAPAHPSDEVWRRALVDLEDDLATRWDAAFCGMVQRRLRAHPDAPLPDMLSALAEELRWLDRVAERLTVLRDEPSALKAKAFGGRLGDLVEGLMRRMDKVDRQKLHEEINSVLTILDEADLGRTIAPETWLRWSADALVRTAPTEPEPAIDVYDRSGYRRVREEVERLPVAYTLAEVALRVDRRPTQDGASPGLGRVAARIAGLPDALRARVEEIELARLTRSIGYLEAWWTTLCEDDLPVGKRLNRVVRSGFFDVIWDEAALTRTALEVGLVADLLPETAGKCDALHKRLEALEERTRRGAQALLQERTDAAWAEAVGPDAG
jgi:MoxR-like ATPase